MSQLNPWLSMWTAPRKTIRFVVEKTSSYGIIWLSAIYGLECMIFYLHFWSLGFKAPSLALFIPSLVFSPLVGFIWIAFYGWIMRSTGKWLGGKARSVELRAAVAWSRLPFLLLLLVWALLWALNPNHLFIQYGPGTLSLIFTLSWGLVQLWSYILFIQAVSVVQHFNILRSLANIGLSWLIYYTLFLFTLILTKTLSLYL